MKSTIQTEMKNLQDQCSNSLSCQEDTSPSICTVDIPTTSSVKQSTKRTHSDFFNLPQNTKYCTSVDVEFGKFYVCALCGVVRVRKDQNRFFTIGRWKEHEASKTHQQAVTIEEERERVEAKRLAGNEALTKREQDFLAQKSKTQTSVMTFFTKKKKTGSQLFVSAGKNESSAFASGCNVSSSTAPTRVLTIGTSPQSEPATCQGIIPKFSNKEFQINLKALSLNGALDGDCSFQIGSYGQWCVVRDVACFGTAGTIRSDKTYQCELCFTIRKNSKKLYKIKEQIQ